MPGRVQPERAAARRRSPSIPARVADSSPQAAADVTRAVARGAAPLSVARDPALAGRAGRAVGRARRRWRSASPRCSTRRSPSSAASRAREGAKLAAVLEARCAGIEAQVARVAPRIPAIHAAFNEKLAARLREAGLDPNEDRLKQELALFATKVDVAEELARLTTHVAEVRRVLTRRRQRRQAPRLPGAGAAPRGQHAGLASRSTPSCRRRRWSSRC